MEYSNLDKAMKQAYETAQALNKIEDKNDLVLIAKAIAPDSIAEGWTRTQITNTIQDVLISRA